jgi:hypothetical protein
MWGFNTFYLFFFLLPLASRSVEMVGNPFYLRCDDVEAQKAYFANERIAFSIDSSIATFNATIMLNGTPDYFPVSCRDSNDNYQKSISYPQFVAQNTGRNILPLSTKLTYFDNIIYNTINSLWKFTKWQYVTLDDEHYMYFENKNTRNIVFYFHGINTMNGLENLYLLRDLTRQASVYIMIYTPLFIFDTDNGYNHTLSERISNVSKFIRVKTMEHNTPYVLMGNSFGSIQITCLCKQYPETCMPASKIILTDPVLLNMPFALTHDAVIYGVLIEHEIYSKAFISRIGVMTVLRQPKYVTFLWNMIDWYEWSIDSLFIQVYSEQLVLVIGKNDSMLNVTASSPIFSECQVIFTDTQHGMVIFDNFMSQVELWNNNNCFA